MHLPPFHLPTLICRHAQTERNADQIPRSAKFTTKVELTDIGLKQRLQLAKWVVEYCKVKNWTEVTVVISPFDRAQVTAEPTLAALKEAGIIADVHTNDLIREHNTGLYGKESVIDNERWHHMREKAEEAQSYHFFTPPGGRSLAETATDQLTFHHSCLLAQESGLFGNSQALILFCHGLQGRLYIKTRMNYDWKFFWGMENLTNASAYLIDEKGLSQGYYFEPTPRTR